MPSHTNVLTIWISPPLTVDVAPPSARRLQRERRRPLGPGPAGLRADAEDQAHADLLQAPPAADNEILLCHQPQPGC